MKVVTYTIEVSYILDLEDPALDELENLQIEPELEEELYEFIRNSVHEGNYVILRDSKGKIVKRYETLPMEKL